MVIEEIYKETLIKKHSLELSDNIKLDLWNITKHNTFVFIEHSLYEKFPKEVKKEIKCIGSNETSDMTVKDMLNENLMFALFSDNKEDINEIVGLIERYTETKLHYLIAQEE